jgi:hypothetical protein
MYCHRCGYQVGNQEFCPSCGVTLAKTAGIGSKPDKPSGLLNILACCFPIVGLILFIVWKDEKPRSAKSVGKWALIGFVLGILLYVIGFALGVLSEFLYYY